MSPGLKFSSAPIHYGMCVCVMLVAQSCPTLCDPMDCSPPGSSVHGILQARILEWVAMPSSRGSSWPRNWNWVSCITGRSYIGMGFPSSSAVKNPPSMQEAQVWSLSREDLLEKGMATHSSVPAWRIPWTEQSERLQSKGLQRVRRD